MSGWSLFVLIMTSNGPIRIEEVGFYKEIINCTRQDDKMTKEYDDQRKQWKKNGYFLVYDKFYTCQHVENHIATYIDNREGGR